MGNIYLYSVGYPAHQDLTDIDIRVWCGCTRTTTDNKNGSEDLWFASQTGKQEQESDRARDLKRKKGLSPGFYY
jgi:hypothetical protein